MTVSRSLSTRTPALPSTSGSQGPKRPRLGQSIPRNTHHHQPKPPQINQQISRALSLAMDIDHAKEEPRIALPADWLENATRALVRGADPAPAPARPSHPFPSSSLHCLNVTPDGHVTTDIYPVNDEVVRTPALWGCVADMLHQTTPDAYLLVSPLAAPNHAVQLSRNASTVLPRRPPNTTNDLETPALLVGEVDEDGCCQQETYPPGPDDHHHHHHHHQHHQHDDHHHHATATTTTMLRKGDTLPFAQLFAQSVQAAMAGGSGSGRRTRSGSSSASSSSSSSSEGGEREGEGEGDDPSPTRPTYYGVVVQARDASDVSSGCYLLKVVTSQVAGCSCKHFTMVRVKEPGRAQEANTAMFTAYYDANGLQ